MRIGNQTVLFKSHTAYKQNSSYIKGKEQKLLIFEINDRNIFWNNTFTHIKL